MGDGVSFLIPARNEKYLQNTIDNILQNIRADSEIIVVLDGYVPDPPINCNDKRVKFISHEVSIGQRAAINEAARESQKDFIMKLDAHSAIDEGMDAKLIADCEYMDTMVPTMYNLDVDTFKPKFHKRTNAMYISWNEKNELRALYYTGKEFRKWHDKPELIHESMACMGPGWFMHKKRFFETGMCDLNHEGGWGAQSIEVSLKAWLSGGRLMTNKKTWFSHYFRGGIGFPYPISGKVIDRVRKYSMDLWLNNKWPLQTRKFSWVVEHFNPPGWDEDDIKALKEQEKTGGDYMTIRKNLKAERENKKQQEQKVMERGDKPVNDLVATRDQLQKYFYHHIHLKGRDPKWRGHKVIKMPNDFLLYSQVIWDKKPDFLIETGSAYFGSALFYADLLNINGNGKVITIDPSPRGPVPEHPRLIYLKGKSKDPEIIKQVKEIVGTGSVMCVLDSDHSRANCKWELKIYGEITTVGQFMVIEDCYSRNSLPWDPAEARDWFLKWNKNYVLEDIDSQFIFAFSRGGWLKRVK